MWPSALKRWCCLWTLVVALSPLAWAQHAIWIWEEDTQSLLTNEPQMAESLHWLRMQGVGTVYLYAGAHEGHDPLVEAPQSYARLIRRYRQAGVEVHALLGTGHLRTEKYVLPENRDRAVHMVQRVLDYNQRSDPAERFEGIHLDIEPHVLDDWSSRREAYLQMWLQVSEVWMAMKRRSGQSIKVAPAIAFWLDGIQVRHAGVSKPASQHLQDIYDHVVLMDYRNRAQGGDGIISHGRDEIEYGRRIGKPVWLGLEFSPNSLSKLTFDGRTPEEAAHEIRQVLTAFDRDPGFAGVVFHHYGTYRRWLARHQADPSPLVSPASP